MEQSPSWEANRFSASQEIPRTLWNSNVHYCIYQCPSPVPILSHIDPVHATTTHFLKIHLNIILPSMPGSSKWSLSFRFPQQHPVYDSPLHTYVTCPVLLNEVSIVYMEIQSFWLLEPVVYIVTSRHEWLKFNTVSVFRARNDLQPDQTKKIHCRFYGNQRLCKTCPKK